MIQLTEEQRERVKQIRDRFGTSRATWQDVGFLLSLLDSDSQAAEGIPDDLPYRVVEQMGFGLTFRSCSCGQLPCARLRPLRDALEIVRRNAATSMRDKCVYELGVMKAEDEAAGTYPQGRGIYASIAKRLESLTLEPLEPEKQKL